METKTKVGISEELKRGLEDFNTAIRSKASQDDLQDMYISLQSMAAEEGITRQTEFNDMIFGIILNNLNYNITDDYKIVYNKKDKSVSDVAREFIFYEDYGNGDTEIREYIKYFVHEFSLRENYTVLYGSMIHNYINTQLSSIENKVLKEKDMNVFIESSSEVESFVDKMREFGRAVVGLLSEEKLRNVIKYFIGSMYEVQYVPLIISFNGDIYNMCCSKLIENQVNLEFMREIFINLDISTIERYLKPYVSDKKLVHQGIIIQNIFNSPDVIFSVLSNEIGKITAINEIMKFSKSSEFKSQPQVKYETKSVSKRNVAAKQTSGSALYKSKTFKFMKYWSIDMKNIEILHEIVNSFPDTIKYSNMIGMFMEYLNYKDELQLYNLMYKCLNYEIMFYNACEYNEPIEVRHEIIKEYTDFVRVLPINDVIISEYENEIEEDDRYPCKSY